MQLELHIEQRAIAGPSSRSTGASRAGTGIAHGGIVCTILDEVMAWSLVAADNWGVTARLAVDFKRPVPVGRTIRAEGWVTEMRRRLVDHGRLDRRCRDGTLLATADGPVRRRDPGAQARAPAAIRLPGRQRCARHGRRALDHDCRSAPRSETTARAVAFVRGAPRGGRGSSDARLPTWSTTPTRFAPRRWRPAFAGLADPEYLEGQRRVAPGHRRRARRPLAADRGRRARLPRRRPAARPVRPCCSSPIGSSASTHLEARWFAFGLLERLVADETGAHLAAAPPRRPARPATGSRSTPSPTRTARASSPSRTAGPSSSSSSSARRAGSAAWSARRSPRCRTSTGARGREPEVADHGLGLIADADRRRRARRPEGARLGAPLADRRRPRRDRRRRS